MQIQDITAQNAKEQKQELLEEVQQFAEELEVSNEELQSTTEELQVANEELRQQSDELIELNYDLRESEGRFRSFYELPLIGIAITSPEKGWIEANDKICDILGYSHEELYNISWDEITYPDDLDKDLEQFNRVLNGYIDGYNIEKRFIRKDGAVVFTYISVGCIRNEDNSVKYFAVLIDDISEIKKAEERLRESEEKFRALIYNSTDIIRILDKNGLIVFDSPSSSRILGYSEGSLIGKSPMEFIHPDDRERVQNDLKDVYKEKNTGIPTEFRIRKANGTYLPVESIAQNLIDIPEIEGIVVNTHPIKDRKKLEEYLIKTNRSLRVLSDCNKSLIRAKDENELLKEICDIIIDMGEYTFVWVGYPDDEKILQPVAFAGKEEKYLQNIHVSWDNTELGKGPSGNAYRKGKEFIINDLSTDESFDPWRDEALKRGYASVISLPLFSKGKIIGIISIYSSEIDRFNEEEIGLLRELASDLAYGIISIRSDIEREKVKNELGRSEYKYRTLFDNAGDGILIMDEDKFIDCNVKAMEIYGVTKKEEIIGKTPYGFFSPKYQSIDELSKKKALEHIKNALNGKQQFFEWKHKRLDGKVKYTEVNLTRLKMGDNHNLMAIVRDITERVKAAKTIKESEIYYKTIFENTGTATIIIEEDKTISLVNSEFEKLYGYSKEDIEGKIKWTDFVADKDDLERMKKYHEIRSNNTTSVPRNYEFKFLNRKREVRDIFITVALIPGTNKRLVSLLDITDKKQSTKALRESKAKLKIAMDMAKLVSWEYDVKTDMFTFDDQFYALYGTSVEKEGKTKMSSEEYSTRFIPPEESYMVSEEINKVLKTDDPNYFQTIEHSIIRADGEKRHILVRLGVVIDDKGQTVKTYGANQDITERKKAEEELKEKAIMLANVNDAVIGTDTNYLINYWNRAAEEIYGYNADEIIGQYAGILEPKFIGMNSEEALKQLESTGELNVQLFHTTKDGRKIIIDSRNQLLFDENGKLYGNIGINRDITERKKAEEALKESEEKYRDLAELLPQPVFESDLNGDVTYVNQIGLETFGYTQEDLDNVLNMFQFLAPEDQNRAIEDNLRMLNGEGLSVGEYTGLRKDGTTFPMITYVNPIIQKNKVIGTRGVLIDISELKKAEEKIKGSLKEKELLLREVHHRVKNNLQIMSSLLNLQSGVIKDERALEAFRDSQTRVRSMALIHGELYQSKNLVNIDFGDYIHNLVLGILSTYSPYSDIKHDINVENIFFGLDTAIPCGLIINELVMNSIKHAFPTNNSQKEKEIKIRLNKENNHFKLIIGDNGIGISDELDITKSDTLGLQLVNSLVDQLDGEIKLNRKNGTEFTILFNELKYKDRF